MKIKYATAQYTGGGIYIYYGQLEDGNYFRAGDGEDYIEVCNADTSMDAADYIEFYEEHRVCTLNGKKYETFWNEMLLWIIYNVPKGNYSVGELENRVIKKATDETAKCSNVVENYLENVIKKSWTWERLTEEEQKRFLSLDFDKIRGRDTTRIEWFHSMYYAFLLGLEYKAIGWRETEEEKENPRF